MSRISIYMIFGNASRARLNTSVKDTMRACGSEFQFIFEVGFRRHFYTVPSMRAAKIYHVLHVIIIDPLSNQGPPTNTAVHGNDAQCGSAIAPPPLGGRMSTCSDALPRVTP